jgi:hypothetical protein
MKASDIRTEIANARLIDVTGGSCSADGTAARTDTESLRSMVEK